MKMMKDERLSWIFSRLQIAANDGSEEERRRWLSDINETFRNRWECQDKITYHVANVRERRLADRRNLIEQVLVDHDPGTAGDAAEEAWADVLRELLPGYKIIVKGVITGVGLKPSPQIDLLVLDPKCPNELHDLKAIPIDVVVAAFECKLNLRAGDIAKAVQTAHILKRASRKRADDPISCIPILYGVLGLGSGIENKVKHPHETVLDAIKRHTIAPIDPMNMLDVIVVPQVFCLAANPTIFCGDLQNKPFEMEFHSTYQVHGGDPLKAGPSDNPLGLFKHKLFSYLEKIDKQLGRIRPMYDLFVRYWPEEVTLSETPLDHLVPRHNIERISRHGYAKGSTVFDFII